MNYYNENDPVAAEWLRNLIKAGHISEGIVDERDIRDIIPTELDRFRQCHFFAGIGVWSYALRRAGWPDDQPVWTGSCPCQPFSSAGKGKGTIDERHLWPDWFHIIESCRPRIIFGEQVASKSGLDWLDIVQTDMEGTGYASGAVDLCAASLGAPHIRQRLWFVAKRLGNTINEGLERYTGDGDSCDKPGRQQADPSGSIAETGSNGGMAACDFCGYQFDHELTGKYGCPNCCGEGLDNGTDQDHTFWTDADWLGCRDGKWRPVESGTFPLVDGTPCRVGRLRAYGNAICAEIAAEFIVSAMTDKRIIDFD